MSKDNFVNDPNYGRGLRICASGEVHFDGEACNCQSKPQVEKHAAAHLGVDGPAISSGKHGFPADSSSSNLSHGRSG